MQIKSAKVSRNERIFPEDVVDKLRRRDQKKSPPKQRGLYRKPRAGMWSLGLAGAYFQSVLMDLHFYSDSKRREKHFWDWYLNVQRFV